MIPRKKVLIIAKDIACREALAQILSEKYQIALAMTPDEAVEKATNWKPDAVVGNLCLASEPELSSFELLKTRIPRGISDKSFPLILLLPNDDAALRVACFRHSADDCLAKPFNAQELLTRVGVRIQSAAETPSRTESDNDLYELSNIRIDYSEKRVEIAGESIDVGHVELRILHFLLKNQKQIVDRHSLNQYVWGDSLPSERALDPHMNSLRKKLKNTGANLRTFYGRGFSLTAPVA